MSLSNATPASLDVVCLCAEWCGTCRDYADRFEQVRGLYPQARFTWLDVEDEADLIDPVAVENFPTLLIVKDGTPLFFGPLLPHVGTLERLLRNSLAEDGPRPVEDAALRALTARLYQSGRLGVP